MQRTPFEGFPRRALGAFSVLCVIGFLVASAPTASADGSRISNDSLPTGLLDSAAVWTGSEALLFGGHDYDGPVNAIVSYDPFNESTTTLPASLPVNLQRHVAFWDPDVTPDCPAGCAYVLGGHNDHDPHPDGAPWERYDGAYRFDADSGTLTTLPWTLPGGLSRAAVAWDPRPLPAIGCPTGCAYVIGGLVESVGLTGALEVSATDDVLRVDPKAGTVTVAASLPQVRFDAAAVFNGEHVFITGGHRDTDHDDPPGVTNPTLRFDPVAGSISEVASHDFGWADHVMIWTGHHAFVHGGGHGRDYYDSRIYKLDLETGRAQSMRNWLTYRLSHVAVWTGTEALIMGGLADTSLLDRIHHVHFRPGPKDVAVSVPDSGDRVNVTLTTWTPVTNTFDAPVLGIDILRAPGGSSAFTTVATVAHEDVTWSDVDVTPGTTYRYKARAFTEDGYGEFGATKSVDVPNVPDAPRAVDAQRGPGLGEITVTWNAPENDGDRDVTGYTVYRALDGGAPSPVARLPATARSFDDTGLADATAYAYHVTALNVVGESAPSAVATATTAANVPPDAPASVGVTAPASRTLRVAWSAAPTGDGPVVRAYHVLAARDGDALARVTTLGADARAWDATGLDAGVTYHYAVEAESDAGTGARSVIVSAVAAVPPDAPRAPAAAWGPGVSDVTVTWDAPLDDGGSAVTGYRVHREWDASWRDDDGSWETRVSVNEEPTVMRKSFPLTADDLAGAVTATVRVLGQGGDCAQDLRFVMDVNGVDLPERVACDAFGAAPAWAAFEVPVHALAAGENHVGFRAGSVASAAYLEAHVHLFVDAEHDAERSRVQTFEWPTYPDGSWQIKEYPGELLVRLDIAYADEVTTDADATMLARPDARPGAVHAFRVQALSSVGESAPTAPVAAATPTVPDAPVATDLTVGPGVDALTLAWDAPARDGGIPVEAYAVYHVAHDAVTGDADPAKAVRVGTVAADARAFTDAGLDAGRAYTVFVRAVNAVGESDRSARLVAHAPDVPDAPSGITALPGPGDEDATVAWSASPSGGGFPSTGFTVHRDGALVATLDADARAFVDAGRAPGAVHEYAVRAVNAVGASAPATGTLTMWNVPEAPRDLAVTRAQGLIGLVVAWDAPVDDGGAPLTGFEVRRGPSPDALTVIATAAADASTFTDADVAPDSGAYYAVTAVNRIGAGDLSPVAHATTLAAPPDCGSQEDATEEGSPLPADGACTGYLAPGDAVDVLLVDVPQGDHLRVTATGPVVRLEGPDGTVRPVVDGEANAHADVGGAWRIIATAPDATGTVAYTVLVEHAPAPALPTAARVTGAPLVRVGEPLAVTVNLMDHHHERVAGTLDWGDGTTLRVPAAGLVPGDGTDLPRAHAYWQPGEVTLTVTGATRDGRALAPASLTVLVVDPDDCGAGDAPDARDAHPIGEGACHGALGGTDGADRYVLDFGWLTENQVPGVGSPGTDPGPFHVVIVPGQGLALDADLAWAPGPTNDGFTGGPFTGKEVREDGTIVMDAGDLAPPPHRFVLTVTLEDGDGAYAVRVVRHAPGVLTAQAGAAALTALALAGVPLRLRP